MFGTGRLIPVLSVCNPSFALSLLLYSDCLVECFVVVVVVVVVVVGVGVAAVGVVVGVVVVAVASRLLFAGLAATRTAERYPRLPRGIAVFVGNCAGACPLCARAADAE